MRIAFFLQPECKGIEHPQPGYIEERIIYKLTYQSNSFLLDPKPHKQRSPLRKTIPKTLTLKLRYHLLTQILTNLQLLHNTLILIKRRSTHSRYQFNNRMLIRYLISLIN